MLVVSCPAPNKAARSGCREVFFVCFLVNWGMCLISIGALPYEYTKGRKVSSLSRVFAKD